MSKTAQKADSKTAKKVESKTAKKVESDSNLKAIKFVDNSSVKVDFSGVDIIDYKSREKELFTNPPTSIVKKLDIWGDKAKKAFKLENIVDKPHKDGSKRSELQRAFLKVLSYFFKHEKNGASARELADLIVKTTGYDTRNIIDNRTSETRPDSDAHRALHALSMPLTGQIEWDAKSGKFKRTFAHGERYAILKGNMQNELAKYMPNPDKIYPIVDKTELLSACQFIAEACTK